MALDPSKAAAALGRLGGKAGTGKAKRRGNSAYYKALRAKRGPSEQDIAKALRILQSELENPALGEWTKKT